MNLKETCQRILHSYEAGHKASAGTELYKLLQENNESSMVQQLHCLILYKERRFEKALVIIERVLKKHPDNAANLNLCGLINRKLNNFDQARVCYERAVKCAPEFHPTYNNLGIIYRYMGEKDKAISCFKEGVRLGENDSAALYNMSCIKAYQFTQDERANLELCIENSETIEDKSRCHFASYNEQAKLKNYSLAFQHLEQGNKLIFDSQTYQYSFYSYVNRIKKGQSFEYFQNRIKKTRKSKAPVFIVGMPRSGSSLLEQMLDSHSKVSGLGETHSIQSLLQGVSPTILNNAKKFQNEFNKLSKRKLGSMAKEYKETLGINYKSTSVYIDKSLDNFKFIGFIKILFPHAKFIHIKRNPMDVCFGCYERKFSEGHEYSYDLNVITDYYFYYDLLMKHWNEVFPDDIYEIEYEGLIYKTERELEECLSFIGLEMEGACLEFYKNKRLVLTSSTDQVREKIFTSSIEKWKHYSFELSLIVKKLRNFGIKFI